MLFTKYRPFRSSPIQPGDSKHKSRSRDVLDSSYLAFAESSGRRRRCPCFKLRSDLDSFEYRILEFKHLQLNQSRSSRNYLGDSSMLLLFVQFIPPCFLYSPWQTCGNKLFARLISGVKNTELQHRQRLFRSDRYLSDHASSRITRKFGPPLPAWITVVIFG